MLRRMQLTYLSLLSVVLAVLTVPLCMGAAATATTQMYLDRAADTARFARLADETLLVGDSTTLQAELSTYSRLYGIGVVVLNRNRQPIAASGMEGSLRSPELGDDVQRVLDNEQHPPPTTIWPWDDGPLVVMQPAVRSGQIVGAAVTSSPTKVLRGQILRRWGLLLALSLLALGAGALAGRPLVRWMLRPLGDLAECTRAISTGQLTARAPVISGPEEVRSLARSFNVMADAVCELLERQRMVVGYAGHQVRNPLAAVRLQVEALADAAPGQVDATSAMAEIERLAGICDSLVALADTGAGPAERVAVGVHEVAEDRLRAWAPLASRRGVTLVRRDIRDAWAMAVPSTLDQVLDALIDNGTKFAGPGGAVAVSVRTSEQGVLLVDVDDSGPGLPPNVRAAAVQPFWRRTDHEHLAGSGLGLSIVVALLDRSGGFLTLSNGPLGGLRATARLEAVPCPC